MHTVKSALFHIAIKIHTNIDQCYLHIRKDTLHHLNIMLYVGVREYCGGNSTPNGKVEGIILTKMRFCVPLYGVWWDGGWVLHGREC